MFLDAVCTGVLSAPRSFERCITRSVYYYSPKNKNFRGQNPSYSGPNCVTRQLIETLILSTPPAKGKERLLATRYEDPWHGGSEDGTARERDARRRSIGKTQVVTWQTQRRREKKKEKERRGVVSHLDGLISPYSARLLTNGVFVSRFFFKRNKETKNERLD